MEHWEDAKRLTPYQPFFAMVSPPAAHTCFNGAEVAADQVDVASRLTFMLKMHKAYPVTGTVATGAVARVQGSVVWDLLSEQARAAEVLRIGHPSGIIPIEALADSTADHTEIQKLGVYRTARMIMEGQVYVRKAVFHG